MKKSLVLLMVFSAFVFGANAAFALPLLQLDVSGGTYGANETIYSHTNPFTLYAYALQDQKFDINQDFFVSVALLKNDQPLAENSVDSSLGSFAIGGTSVNVAGDMTWGTPPLPYAGTVTQDNSDLQAHSIFPTYFTEIGFKFDTNNLIAGYNTQDCQGGFESLDPSCARTDQMYYQKFEVTLDQQFLTAVQTAGYDLHFDLYTKEEVLVNGKKQTVTKVTSIGVNAPFSHDAQTGEIKPTPTPTTPPVPEPGTIFLLGAGLIGLLGFARKLKK